MVKKTFKDYLNFLKIALEYIEAYNNERQKYKELIDAKEKLTYHLFCYSQLVYILSERLKKEFPKDGIKINKFFTNKSTYVGIFYIVGNNWKHQEPMEVRQTWSVMKNRIEEVNRLIKKMIEESKYKLSIELVEMVNPKIKLPVNHYLNKNDEDLVKMARNCFEMIKKFCIDNGYIKTRDLGDY